VREATVLLVEDDPDMRTLVGLALPDLAPKLGRPVRVVAAADVDEALLHLRCVVPDLMLLDVSLPVVDGWELCRRFKADPLLRAVPIVMVTALQPTAELVARVRDAGCADLLPKPFDLDELLAVAQRHLGG
jgi:two-component system cell cycle response regulator DivK